MIDAPHRVFRVRVASVQRETPGGAVGVQAVAYAVALSRRDVPSLIDAALPEFRGAPIEIIEEVPTDAPLRPVRIGVGEPRQFMLARGATREEVHRSLLDAIPSDSPWRRFVEDEWYEVGELIALDRPGVF